MTDSEATVGDGSHRKRHKEVFGVCVAGALLALVAAFAVGHKDSFRDRQSTQETQSTAEADSHLDLTATEANEERTSDLDEISAEAASARTVGHGSQAEILEDRVVTRAESDSATQATIACARDAGVVIADIREASSGLELAYEFESPDPEHLDLVLAAHEQCYDEYLASVQAAYTVMQFPETAAAQSAFDQAVIACMDARGFETQFVDGTLRPKEMPDLPQLEQMQAWDTCVGNASADLILETSG